MSKYIYKYQSTGSTSAEIYSCDKEGCPEWIVKAFADGAIEIVAAGYKWTREEEEKQDRRGYITEKRTYNRRLLDTGRRYRQDKKKC